jgi:hypothetical protein
MPEFPPQTVLVASARRSSAFCRTLWLCIVAATLFIRSADGGQNLELLTNATQVLRLTSREAAKGYPVLIRGVITYSDPAWKFAVVQDEVGGVAFELKNEPYPKRGDLVEVRGTSGPGVFAPGVSLLSVSILGTAPLPRPRRVSLEQIQSGREDSQWIEVEGVVRAASKTDEFLVLEIASSGSRVKIITRDLPAGPAEGLVEATVRARGVCGGMFNAKRQLVAVQLLVTSRDDIVVVQQPASSPFTLPVSGINELLSYGSADQLWKRVHIRGVATCRPGHGLSSGCDGGSDTRTPALSQATKWM